jgi:hypothetical protein
MEHTGSERRAAGTAPEAAAAAAAPVTKEPAPAAKPAGKSSGGSAHVIPRENPVLGSIVQQFDKLRQQRASDRTGGGKAR